MEEQYINLVKDVLQYGDLHSNRNISSLSLYGKHLIIYFDDGFPILTTKKIWFKGVVCELLWMLNGYTNLKLLAEDNGSKEFLNKQGELGGYQWRNFGGDRLLNNGIDQLSQVINNLKSNPFSRKHIITSWNPKDALPPCHCFVQFLVDSKKGLTTILTQRSADIGLDLPFNITSYSLLTYIIGHLTNLIPKKLIINIGDAHIYLNHKIALENQIKRKPLPLPQLHIIKNHKNISDFSLGSFMLNNYNHYPSIN
ncbi:thymidylate synthase [Spirochaetia bacterium]|nr:thymidylate synthase [Spirochaetia bacterium]